MWVVYLCHAGLGMFQVLLTGIQIYLLWGARDIPQKIRRMINEK